MLSFWRRSGITRKALLVIIIFPLWYTKLFPIPELERRLTEVRGRCSWFGGPDDRTVQGNEKLSFYPNWFARKLNVEACYCAMRITRDFIDGMDVDEGILFIRKNIVAVVRNPLTLAEVRASIVDTGPHIKTKRLIDLSPACMEKLGVGTDDMVCVNLEVRTSAYGLDPYGVALYKGGD